MNLSSITAATLASAALALSDGTPVEGVKITSKDNIQVRVPASHPLGAADPLRIFRRDGSHYKNQTSIRLVATAADAPAAPAPAAAPAAASNDNTVYEVEGSTFDNLADAKQEAIDIFKDDGSNVQIVAISRKVVGVVGFTSLAA